MGKEGLDATEKPDLTHTYMLFGHGDIAKSGIFITFSGNCKEALTLYKNCFGGELYFDTFQEELAGYTEKPVIVGTMVSESIVIYGSDLVQEEGRKIGNYLSVFLLCQNAAYRDALITKLTPAAHGSHTAEKDQQLVEIIDAFDVRWVLSV